MFAAPARVGKTNTAGECAHGGEVSRIEEGIYQKGQWLAGRILNGDERLRLVPNHEFGMARIKLRRPEADWSDV